MLLQTPAGAEAHLAGRILLSAAAPFQRLIDKASITHHFLNKQTARILRNDGHGVAATWVEVHQQELNAGSDWADSGWKNSFHMWDPITGSGFKGWPDALEATRHYHDQALEKFRAEAYGEAFFYLGAAAHIVQDLCVPQHAAATVGENHRPFETFAKAQRDEYSIEEGGEYDTSKPAEVWVKANALIARPMLRDVGAGTGAASWAQALRTLLPLAQRTSAGYIHAWLTEAGAL